jgi:hypothetical protein
MIRHAPPARASLREEGIQRLNPIDRTMRCIDVAIRQLGYPGLETQMLAWLDGRLDPARLRAAIGRLGRRFPVIAARLVETGSDGLPAYWQFRSGATCMLREWQLDSDAPQAVLDHASQVLSDAQDPATADPLEFHLLHRPGGKDVLLLQYNHVLMDNTAAVPLLDQLDHVACCDDESGPANTPANAVAAYLRRFPALERHTAVRDAIELQAHALRGRAATLVPLAARPPGPARLAIATRSLDASETVRLRSRIVARYGFPCLSMAILGSAFRAIDRLGPAPGDACDFVAALGIPIPRDACEALAFQNRTSAVPIRLSRPDVQDQDRAVCVLRDQLRERLARRTDLGVLCTTAVFDRRFRYVEWVVWHLLRYGYSLWYAYFGALDRGNHTVLGRTVEDLFYTGGPIWPSIGISLLVNQYHGRLRFQATFDPRLIPAPLAGAFLDVTLSDLMPS